MDLEEFVDEYGRKKKKRKLIDIDVDEITLCGSAASRKTFIIKKGKTMDEIIELIEEFLESGIGKQEIDEAKLKQAVKTLLAYKGDLPDDIKSALDTILKWASKEYGYGYPARKSRGDDFPSIPIVGPARLLAKMIPDDDDDDEEISEWDE